MPPIKKLLLKRIHKELQMGKYEGIKIAEASLLGPIHTVKSGQVKEKLRNVATATDKAVGMVLNGNLVELTITSKNGSEVVFVPVSFFSHLVPATVLQASSTTVKNNG